jgi:hypothetical protein
VTEKKRAGLPMQTAKPEPEHFAKSIYDGIAFFSRGRFYWVISPIDSRGICSAWNYVSPVVNH